MAASVSSSTTRRGAFATAFGVLVVAAYCVALHLLIADRTMPRTTLALALAPCAFVLPSLCARKRRDRRLRASSSAGAIVAAVVAAIVAVIVAASVLWRFGDALVSRVDRVVYLENLAFNLFLALVFAVTLRPGHEALVTRLARSLRGVNMPDAIVRYTRAVTAAWAIYFVAIAAISTVLFLTQSREVWSIFINLLVWPLTAAMFVVEYAVRLRVLRAFDHASLFAAMRAFRRRAS